MKDKCIIIDLDGTLAETEHRRRMLKETQNWRLFKQNMALDTVNLWCREIIEQFKHKYKIVIATGRSEESRSITEKWLRDNTIHYDALFFRKRDDFRDDTIVKKEIYQRKIKEKYTTLFVVDDRKKVVKMWRDEGLVCLHCDWGDF